MPWPNIFFGGKKNAADRGTPPSIKPAPESLKPAPTEPKPPTIKPVPAHLGPQVVPTPIARAPEVKPIGTQMPTLPVTHGVVLRPPTALAAPISTPPIQPPRAVNPPKAMEPLKNIEQLMTEADPVKTLRQTGNVRVLPPLTAPETEPLPPATTVEQAKETRSEHVPIDEVVSQEKPANPEPISPQPFIKLTLGPSALEVKRDAPVAVAPDAPLSSVFPAAPTETPSATHFPSTSFTPIAPVVLAPIPPPDDDNDSPFILQPAPVPAPAAAAPAAEGAAPAAKVQPPTNPNMAPLSSIYRRKAKLADVARIVLPPKREDTQRLHAASAGPSPTVVPPAFPIASMTARASGGPAVNPPLVKPASPEAPDPAEKGAETEVKPLAEARPEISPEVAKSPETEPAQAKGDAPPVTMPPEIATQADKPAEPKPAAAVDPKLVEPLIATSDAPKVDPEAHKPEPSAHPEPKVDPEAHRSAPKAPEPAPKPAEAAPVTTLSAPTPPREKREFHLANGERVAGVVLSETPDAVYLEHTTLGVLTIPRSNIAKRLVEIILINGDRIVGDIMAETADTLYVRHASLGMLTVPRAQRSTRVVEAILKDGDRILGEVLTETDTFTVIRSATLGTITVPHNKIEMLNRKLEQIEMKALPPAVPELKDKPTS